MNRFAFILVLLLQAISLHAACTQAGPGIWRCSDSGDPYTNGMNLADFLNSQPFSCGDTIVLQAGVSFRATDGNPDPFWRLKRQIGCGQKYTTIMSSALAEIPLKQKQNLVNYRSKMPSLEVSNAAAFYLYYNPAQGYVEGANNYRISGIRITTTAYAVANRLRVSYLGFNMGDVTTATEIAAARPKNIEIDRCIFEEYEEQAYGDANTSNTEGRAFMRSVGVAIGGLPWKNLYMHDSYVKITGYSNNTSEGGTTALLTITGALAQNPAVVQGSGLAASLGITYSSSCVTGVNMAGFFDGGPCNGHAARVVIQGATASWAPLNGPRYVIALSDGNLSVFIPDSDFGSYHPSAELNASSFGPFTSSSPKLAGVKLLTQYAFLAVNCENVRIIDNHLEAWAMPIFMGGADGVKLDPATIQSGSTSASLVLDHVRGLQLGDIITANVPTGANSVYCHHSSGVSCANVGGSNPSYRSGRVTAIAGTTVTIEPWGPNGIDVNPSTGGLAWWDNLRVRNVEIRGNNLSRGYLHPNGDAGKGAIEMKHCESCLIDGNVMNGHLDSNNVIRANMNAASYFTEAKSQSGTDPNVTIRNVRFSNNLASGQLPGSGTASCNWRVGINLADDETSQRKGENVYIEHSLHIGCKAVPGNRMPHVEILAATGGGYKHNTFAPDMQSVNHLFLRVFDCNSYGDPFEPEYKRNSNVAVKDNIMGHGLGAYEGAPNYATCWPTKATDVAKNIIVDTQSIGTSTINSLWPNNYAVADYTGMWAGTCAYDNWLNCKLSPSNPQRGTASDGGDPGADVEQIKDRIERWSEGAGLLQPNLHTTNMELNPSSWQIGSVSAAVRSGAFSASGLCTVELFTVRNRSAGHADTNSSGRKACLRTGSLIDDSSVTFVFGSFSALTPSTTYFYRITNGIRVMVGEFKTLAARTGTAQWPLQLSAASTLTYAPSVDFSGSTTLASGTKHQVPVPAGGVVYWRVDATGKRSVFVAP